MVQERKTEQLPVRRSLPSCEKHNGIFNHKKTGRNKARRRALTPGLDNGYFLGDLSALCTGGASVSRSLAERCVYKYVRNAKNTLGKFSSVSSASEFLNRTSVLARAIRSPSSEHPPARTTLPQHQVHANR